VQTDAAYTEIHPLFLRKGAFFLQENELIDRKVCVISTTLATELFFSLDVLGQDVLLNEEAYKIVGVYEPSESLLNCISTDGQERVFIPYTTAPDDQAQLDALYVVGNTPAEPTDENAFLPNPKVTSVMRAALSAFFDHKLDGYERTDYLQTQRLLEQAERVFWFCMGLVAFLFIARALIRTVTGAFTWLQHTRKSVEAVRFWPLTQRVALPLVCVVVMAALFYLCRFQIYWPPEYVPEGNQLLYLPFYWNLIIQSFQKFNASDHISYRCLLFYGSWADVGFGGTCIIAWWRALAGIWTISEGKLPS
jgi:hypothetical protein